MEIDKKIYLYIKTSPLGLKYLGKTIKDPYLYMGSGKIWKLHLKKHLFTDKDIKTEIIFETYDALELAKIGKEYSDKFDIVNSNEWANLRDETGDGGDTSKFIDYSNPYFHNPDLSKRLNKFKNEKDKDKIIKERTSKIDYSCEERKRKIKENTNWEKWRLSIKNRNTNYAFLSKVHQGNKKPVLQLNKSMEILNEFDSASDAAKILGFKNGGNITNCCKGRCKTFGGFIWIYKK